MATNIKIPKNTLNKMESIIQTELKKILKDKGLYDTGELYNSIDISIKTTSDSDLIMEINAANYLKYLLTEYKILDTLYESKAWDEVLELYCETISNNILDNLM